MRKLFLCCVAAALWACGDASGPAASWAGSWDVQSTPAAGYLINPASFVLTLRDSAGKIFAATPSIVVSDTAGVGDMSWSGVATVESGAVAHDSVTLTVSGAVDGILGYHWNLTWRGKLAGSNAAGTLVVRASELPGQTFPVGTWSGNKQ